MNADSTDPSQIEYWKERLVYGDLLKAIKTYPKDAKNVFGEAAVARRNLLHLGMILGAREILAESPDEPGFRFEASVEDEIQSLVDGLPHDQRPIAREFLSLATRKEIATNFARRIIREATGSDPPEIGEKGKGVTH